MRTVSFSHPEVQQKLASQFECVFTDTTGNPTAGSSLKHAPRDSPGPCGRGAGRQNVQTIFMTPKQEIIHVSTGFLSGRDLVAEMDFAKSLFDKMLQAPEHQASLVESEQVRRLKNLGFDDREISQPFNPLTDMMIGGPNPKDMGLHLPGPGNRGQNAAMDLFAKMDRQRILKDARYVIDAPLRSRESFEQDPGQLVGRGKTFFGSTGSSTKGSGQPWNRSQQQVPTPFR